MVCRESRLSSAIVTFARDMSGLEDNQVLGLNHALMQEGAAGNAFLLHPGEWDTLIDQTIADYRAGRLAIAPGSRNPVNRLEQARNEVPDAQRFYAAVNLIERSRRARDAQVNYFNAYARDFGVPAAHASTEFWVAFHDATDDSRVHASPAFVRAWESNPDNSNLMVDRRSLYAYEQMEIARASRLMQQDERPAVTRQPVHSTAIAEMGYDASSGRLEIVMNSNPNRVYAYVVPESVYSELSSTRSPGSYFARNIRGRSEYAYASAAESDAAAVHRRCATCGQFAGGSHSCPITGSEEDLNRDVRLAVERARATAAGLSSTSQLPAVSRMAPVHTVRYVAESDGNEVSMRIPGVSRVTQQARREAQVQIPVRAVYNDRSGDVEMVSGNVLVNYNGRGLGYAVTPITQPGDSGNDQLQCTCARYRATYHCEHVDLVVSRITGLTNGTGVATRAAATAATEAVTADLTGQFAASVAATEAGEQGWRGVSTSFVDNPEAFQDVYEDYRAEWAAYKDAVAGGADPATLEYPVPYIRENAFGGLAQRGSNRGFGVEIEFSFPAGYTLEQQRDARAAIGQELYSLELTDQRTQKGYGSSHGAYRDQHRRGWSFEDDPSTGTYPGYGNGDTDPIGGGELVGTGSGGRDREGRHAGSIRRSLGGSDGRRPGTGG